MNIFGLLLAFAQGENLQSNDYNNTMLWGTYRSSLYFGTRTRTPSTLLTGLMWFGTKDLSNNPWENVRHTCEQNDKLVYTWDKHNGRDYGAQTIYDPVNNIKLNTEFIKLKNGLNGGDWHVKITGQPLHQDHEASISLLYYIGFDGPDGTFTKSTSDGKIAKVSGRSKALGEFTFTAKDTGNTRPDVDYLQNDLPSIDDLHMTRMNIPHESVWMIKDMVVLNMITNAKTRIQRASRQLHPNLLFALTEEPEVEDENVYVFQHALQAPFEISYTFHSGAGEVEDAVLNNSDLVDELIEKASTNFDEQFERVFHLKGKFSKQDQTIGKSLLGNMLGSIGYFHGTSVVDNSIRGMDEDDFSDSDDAAESEDEYFEVESVKRPPPNPQLEGPYTLFTDVPSRPFFPRGFLWDTGFSLPLIEAFDTELSMDIIKSWAALIDEDGWLAREQILGNEARSRVPAEFQTQYPHYANPPTLIGALKHHLEHSRDSVIKIEGSDNEKQHLFLEVIYPKFKKNYEWFKKTQSGQVNDWNYGVDNVKAFKWRGRKGIHMLTSGIDDYPRSEEAHPGDLHLDLQCWMIYYARTMGEIAVELGFTEDVAYFERDRKEMTDTLMNLFWDDEEKAFGDITFNDTDEVEVVVHRGYISIFPLLLGILPKNSDQLGHTLDLIRDPKHLWSPFGVCSLSKQDRYFGQGENYWRGPIWLPINYLILQSLHNNYMADGPYIKQAQSIYKDLRSNIIQTVLNQHKQTGFAWEQYGCEDGKGARSHPFTGWTSLVLLIMSEKY